MAKPVECRTLSRVAGPCIRLGARDTLRPDSLGHSMAEDLSSHQKQAESPRGQRLETWGEIASYLGREIRTVQRWEKSMGLPVHRLGGASDKSRVFAFRSELDTWWKDHETRANAADSESAASLVAVAPATPHRTPN